MHRTTKGNKKIDCERQAAIMGIAKLGSLTLFGINALKKNPSIALGFFSAGASIGLSGYEKNSFIKCMKESEAENDHEPSKTLS